MRVPQSIATYLLPSVLSGFVWDYPNIGFDISSCAYETLIDELKTGITDMAFLLADDIPFSELTFELLRIESLFIVSNPSHPLAALPKIGFGDLAQE